MAPNPVQIARGIITEAREHLPGGASQVFVVTTPDVWRHQGERLVAGLAGIPFHRMLLPGGEEHKRLAPLEPLACQMMEAGADRASLIVAFGGGIVTDMAGFLAAIFMRGIPVVQVPTTLLAMVDAAIGGKTGVNLPVGKNLLGSFHQPAVVLIDPAAVDTLPEREYRAGLWEVIKHGIIRDEALFEMFEIEADGVLGREPARVDRMIRDSVRIKEEVVAIDEREGGLRRILNFGHTFGHALEAETQYKHVLHGEAVAWGMGAATRLALSLGMLAERDALRILAVLERFGPIPALDGIVPEAIEQRLAADKKTREGQVHFVLPVRIGEVVVRAGIAREPVLAAISASLP